LKRRDFCIASVSAATFVTLISPNAEANMKRRPINPNGGARTYAQAHEVTNASRFLFISGQIPVARDNSVPKDFKAQASLTWANVEAQLKAADMTLDNLVRFTIYLSDRKYILEEYEVRKEVLGNRSEPAMTIIIAGIYNAAWLLEIEAIAAA
jgi:2-iminobutanoate/2-iminopropanoate deaminase